MSEDRPSAIRPAGDNPLARGINIFVYADPGAGKTPFIATGEKTLIIDSDEGSASAAGSKAEIWVATDWVTMDEIYEYLRHTQHGFKNVWWDGISIGQDKLLEDVMIDLIKPQNQGGRGKSHRKPYLIDQGEYGENFMRIRQWVRHMHAQPFNFGITAFPSPFEDEATEEEKLWPWVQGRNMPKHICSTFDIIAYGKREEGKFKIYVEETEEYYARDRFGALGKGLISPTIPQIERLVREKVGVSGKPVAAKKVAPIKKVAAKVGPKPVSARRK